MLNEKMFKIFQNAGRTALIMNHYELEEKFPEYSLDQWRGFLQVPRVQEYIRSEFAIIQESEMRKVISSASENDTSVGKAQLINAMLNATDKVGGKREGNIAIVSFVLPNEEQAKAPNVEIIKRDPFKEERKWHQDKMNAWKI